MNTFDKALDFVLRHEGGYVNDPDDAGGETNFGISKQAYPDVDIENLTLAKVAKIYRQDYWIAAKCEVLPPMVACAVFDTAVNMGVAWAIRLLQKAVYAASDGVIGPNTLAAVEKMVANKSESRVLIDFLSWRLWRYRSIPAGDKYMRGWSLRVLNLQAELLGGQ